MASFFRAASLIVISLFFAALLLEAGLLFFPVNEGLHTQPVDKEHPFLHFEPNRTSTWSKFADFSLVNTVHSNNFGFLNDQDYVPTSKQPLLTVIGDSYVEAAMIPYVETIQGRLASKLESEDMRVYSFGASGAPLSQYLAYAQFAKDTFHPAKMVFVVVGNDFDESMLSPASSPGFHYFADEGNTLLSFTRLDFTPSPLTELARHSNLAMYLLTNLQVQHLGARIKGLFSKQDAGEFAGQTRADASERRLALSERAIQAFFERLPEVTALPPGNILFVVDGVRPQLYTAATQEESETSYFGKMRTRFIAEASRRGYRIADMQPLFRSAHQATGQRFEFESDGHWNAEGHRLAAEAVFGSALLK